MKNANKNFVIDTGLVEFKLPFDRGTESIYFNPNDVDFFTRIQQMIDKISGLYDELSDRYENAETSEGKMAIICELNDQIKAEFDAGFGNKVSDVIFKYVSPHGIIKSKKQYYAFYILDFLIPLIAEETGETAKKTVDALAKAVNAHTAKYQHKLK